ncbi:hypothetical protein M758_UG295900 [Ceratodon purpureus]|nr:hypothetical protein M758_UG295900 [Ceratodon purpureus]
MVVLKFCLIHLLRLWGKCYEYFGCLLCCILKLSCNCLTGSDNRMPEARQSSKGEGLSVIPGNKTLVIVEEPQSPQHIFGLKTRVHVQGKQTMLL